MLSAKRDGKAAARFFRKVLKAQHTGASRVITVDKNAAYPAAIETLKKEETLPGTTELRQVKYLNNIDYEAVDVSSRFAACVSAIVANCFHCKSFILFSR